LESEVIVAECCRELLKITPLLQCIVQGIGLLCGGLFLGIGSIGGKGEQDLCSPHFAKCFAFFQYFKDVKAIFTARRFCKLPHGGVVNEAFHGIGKYKNGYEAKIALVALYRRIF
jgi:hypothetical protein